MVTGSIVALVTPMQNDFTIDYLALDRLLEFHYQSGTNAVVIAGTTGESATLDFNEHKELIAYSVTKVKDISANCSNIKRKKMLVIAGTGANSTNEAIELTISAAEVGADIALLVTPYYNKPTQEGLYQHYKKVAQECQIPQILYNVPNRTACDLLPETIARLAKIDNIIGVKEASGIIDRVLEFKKLIDRNDFILLSGDDSTAVEFILLGGHGNISVAANVVPQELKKTYKYALSGDKKLAFETEYKIKELYTTLFLESNPIPVKWALSEMELIQPAIRLPLTILSEKYQQQMRFSLQNAGCL